MSCLDHAKVEFDLVKAVEAVLHYSKSTGANCVIIDTGGEVLYDTSATNACEFCKKVQTLLKDNSFCQSYRIYGAQQSIRFGGKYIYLCPMGLVNWASPITVEGIMVGAFISGAYLMMEPSELLIEEISKKFSINKEKLEALSSNLDTMPLIEPSMVNSLSELLFIISCYTSDIKHFKYIEEQNNQKNLSNIADYIQQLKNMEDKNSIDRYPLEKEKRLLSLVKLGYKAEAQELLNEIVAHIFYKTGGNFNLIKTRILELLVLLSRIVLNSSADQELILELNYKYIWEINNIKDIDKLTLYLNKIFIQFFDYLFNFNKIKHVDAIYKAIDYVKNNYLKKITLDEVASYVQLSPAYFSKIFKQEMKMNFNNYLSKIRIEKSKTLLLNEELSLIDVSYLVGFSDQSYFSKVFKRVVGVTPGRYRACKGKIMPISEISKNDGFCHKKIQK